MSLLIYVANRYFRRRENAEDSEEDTDEKPKPDMKFNFQVSFAFNADQYRSELSVLSHLERSICIPLHFMYWHTHMVEHDITGRSYCISGSLPFLTLPQHDYYFHIYSYV